HPAELRPIGPPVPEDDPRLERPGMAQMSGTELVEALLVAVSHDGMHGDAALALAIATMTDPLAQHAVSYVYRLALDNDQVAAPGEISLLVEHIGNAARHAGSEIAPGAAEHDNDAAGHVFAAMIADAFDNCDRTRIPHGKALAGDAAEIAFALGRAVKYRI